MINPSEKLELHYFFNDDSHHMSASVRHDCEKEILLIIKELTTLFNFDIEVESEAYLQGGLKDIWKFIGKNNPQVTFLLTLIVIILSRIPVENKQLVNLQIENLTLDNEIKRNELKTIHRQIKSNQDVTNEIVDEVIKKLDTDYKLNWHKSNFFKKVNFYPKVNKISTQLLDGKNNPTNEKRTIFRNEFPSLIIHSNKIPPAIDNEATIDIVSPVLTKGNFQWKGIYKGQVLSFEMKDKIFENSVLNKQVEFVNGIAIKCVLHQNRNIDETGTVKILNSQVLTVIKIVDSNGSIETIQGIKYKRLQKENESQTKLF